MYNYGNHRRDFTYIDDIVEGVLRVLDQPATRNDAWSGDHPDAASSQAPWRLYNIGASRPVELMDFIAAIERAVGREVDKEFLPMQLGDVPDTYADVSELAEAFGYQPSTPVEEGVKRLVEWYREYYSG